jgi:hypothetical protein
LVLTNSKGQAVQSVALTGRGAGQVTLHTGKLPAGTYTCSLYVGAQRADSQKLLLVR